MGFMMKIPQKLSFFVGIERLLKESPWQNRPLGSVESFEPKPLS